MTSEVILHFNCCELVDLEIILKLILFQEVEGKHLGSKDSISSKIDMDTKVKIEAMNRSVAQNKVDII